MADQTSTTKTDAIVMVPVDLAQVKLTGKKSKLDANEDAWEFSAPPEPGIYPFKLLAPKDGFKQGRYDPKDAEAIFYAVSAVAVLQSNDSDVNGFTTNAYFSTRIQRRKAISTAAGIIVKMGYRLPSEADDLQVAKMLQAALKQERVVEGELDWRGSYKDGDKYVNVWNTYGEFPDNPEGGKLHIGYINDKQGNRHEVRAQAQIKKWYGKGEAKEGIVSSPKTRLPVATEPELAPVEAAAPPIVKPVAAAPPPAAASADNDLELLLQA